MTLSVQSLLQKADADRKAMNWHAARTGYQLAQQQDPDSATTAHNLALCQLAQGDTDAAITQCRRALKLNPQLWQSALVLAKALIKRNDKPTALVLLQRLHAQLPHSADIRVELATLCLHLLGDAPAARQLVAPLLSSPQHGRDAHITTLVTQLYDRDPGTTASQVNQAFLDFGAQQLPLADAVCAEIQSIVSSKTKSGKKRLRVGLISPQFFASPVYFFSFGALQQLSLAVDLVFFNRGTNRETKRETKRDWASDAFSRIATDWFDVAPLGAEQLAKEIARHQLDALIDLGGWMDPVALSALSAKPAKKLYKWVGGQSVTTGLKSFDGFLTDRYQTPKGSDALYSEPLIRLKSGYVTYTPPPYMPAPQLPAPGSAAGSAPATTLGVIANPGKVSRAFLADLAQRHQRWQANSNTPVKLRFIDYRYQHPAVRQRVQAAFTAVEIEFVSPTSHLAYLTAVSQLDATIDTTPYSGGLTTIEALAVGVPAYTHIGELFCERHTHAHCRYAGMDLADFRLDRFHGQPQPGRTGQTLLKRGSPRTDHARLADELLSLLH